MNFRQKENPQDIIGRVYGQLKVLKLQSTEPVKRIYGDKEYYTDENRFLCKCLNCGREIVVWEHLLKNDAIRSCGCIGGRAPMDYSGQRYDMLVADHRINDINDPNYGMWVFKCDCGKTKITTVPAIMQRKRKSSDCVISCGCMNRKNRDKGYVQSVNNRMIHAIGEVVDKSLLKQYYRMITVCYIKASHSYKYIGGRGIGIDKDWYERSEETRYNYNPMLKNFVKWAHETGYRPGYRLDRIDRDKDFGPTNCYWNTTGKNNTRHSNKMIRYNGRVYNMMEFDRQVLHKHAGYTEERLLKVKPFYKKELLAIIHELHHPELGTIHFNVDDMMYRNNNGFQILMPKYEVEFYG